MDHRSFFQQLSPLKTIQVPQKTYHFHYLDSVDSTNSYAKKYEGEFPAVFLSPNQTSGRGRFEREWVSPPYSGLCFTALYTDLPWMKNPGLIPIICAVSVTDALNDLYGLQPDIKWPNDIYLDNGKIVGILVESVARENRIEKFILGIGVNLFLPEDRGARKQLAELPTNPRFLEEFMTTAPEPFQLLERIVYFLDTYLFCNNSDEILQKWTSYCPHINKETRFTYKGEQYTGMIRGINKSGELIVDAGGGEMVLSSSDIFFS